MKFYLADVSVWVALTYDRHLDHGLARRWFDSSDDVRLLFCRLSQLGLLRLLTNSALMGTDVQSQQQAWRAYDRTREHPRVGFQAETEGLDTQFRKLTQSPHPRTKHWSDAYLAALALSSDLHLVTLDRTFPRMPGLDVLCLTAKR